MALQAARIYARIAPASSHARHMPSHVFLPLGMWDEAARRTNRRSRPRCDREAARGCRRRSTTSTRCRGCTTSTCSRDGSPRHARRWVGGTSPRGGGNRRRRKGTEGEEHQHESEIGRGYGPMSLKSELASMKARLVIESGDWTLMKGQGTFDNIDELFALGMASVPLARPRPRRCGARATAGGGENRPRPRCT